MCLSLDGTRLLVGTKGAEVFEISAADGSDLQGGPLTAGHFSGKLNGVAVHPIKPEYCTCGDDGTLRVWDLYSRTLLKATTFDSALRCVAYHPNGDLILVGFGGGLGGKGKSKKEGAFVILNEPDLTATYEVSQITGDGQTIPKKLLTFDGRVVLKFLLVFSCVFFFSPSIIIMKINLVVLFFLFFLS